MLILFDIDGTLLRTDGAGRKAMTEAGREVCGEAFTLEGIEIAGRLDPLIWHDAARAVGVEDPAVLHDRFRREYARRLEARLDRGPVAKLLPGVADLVESLLSRAGVTIGVLTGNYPETGRLKIGRAGLDPDRFEVGAWGSDAASRPDLVPVALAGHAARGGGRLEAEAVLIIGDTPHDVACARAHGCRSLAVGTGPFDLDALRACGPDRAVADLSETDAVLRWIVSVAPSVPEQR